MMEESRCEEEEDRRVVLTMSVLGPQGYTIYIYQMLGRLRDMSTKLSLWVHTSPVR